MEELEAETQTVRIEGGTIMGREWTLNGIAFEHPSQPPYENPTEQSSNTQIIPLLPFQPTLLIMVNPLAAPHPFHLHGHYFYILGSGKGAEMNREEIRYSQVIKKDTLTVPADSWAAVYFVTDNPGYWLFHCHIEWHQSAGMTLIFSEGQELIPPPPDGFPTCPSFSSPSSSPTSSPFLFLASWLATDRTIAPVVFGMTLTFLGLLGIFTSCWVLTMMEQSHEKKQSLLKGEA